MAKSKIFVVDDESQMRKAIAEALTRSGYAVESFASAMDVVPFLDANACSLVITDVKMPKMSGIDLLQKVKEVAPSIPVVVMTAFGTIQDAVKAMKLGAFDYLLKPFSLEDIEKTVRKVLTHAESLTEKMPEQENARHSKSSKKFITQDPAMQRILMFIEEVAGSRSTVLIQGESGTGKEIIARMVHAGSSCAGGPFVAVNCAAIPEGLLESELFGHEKGAFSGAVSRKIGKFEQANRGTLLLDEIGEMDLALQVKLLRVLQEGEIDRVGGSGPIPVNARIIATTNRDLRQEVREERFREDLFYRLNVVPIQIPPLRERVSDIQPIGEHLLKHYAVREGKKIEGISKEGLALLKGFSYPGNVRELENLIERSVLLCKGPRLEEEHLTAPDDGMQEAPGKTGPKKNLLVKDMEQELILDTLRKAHGNRTQASNLLGISIRTLRNKLAEYRKAGISVPPYDPGSGVKKKKPALHYSEK